MLFIYSIMAPSDILAWTDQSLNRRTNHDKRGGPPEYQLDNEQPIRWVAHDRLQRVWGEKPIPLQLAQQDRDYTLVKTVPRGKYYAGYPWPEA